jgi:membrane-associated protease RseP (regulator of RpoE activity)
MGGENMTELGESLLIRGLDHVFGPPVPEGMTALYSPVAFGAWGGFFVTMINLLPVGQLDGGHVAYALFGKKQDDFAPSVHRAMLAFFGVILVGHLARDLVSGRVMTPALVSRHISEGLFWLVWFQVVGVLGTLSTRAQSSGGDAKDRERRLPIQTRAIAILGLIVIASFGRNHPSWLLVGAFFVGLALLVAMEVTSGVLRRHRLLDHPPTSAEGLDPVRKVLAVVTLAMFALLFMPEPFGL